MEPVMDNMVWPILDTQMALDIKSLGGVNRPISALPSSCAQSASMVAEGD